MRRNKNDNDCCCEVSCNGKAARIVQCAHTHTTHIYVCYMKVRIQDSIVFITAAFINLEKFEFKKFLIRIIG